jgi:hypothetical protein
LHKTCYSVENLGKYWPLIITYMIIQVGRLTGKCECSLLPVLIWQAAYFPILWFQLRHAFHFLVQHSFYIFKKQVHYCNFSLEQFLMLSVFNKIWGKLILTLFTLMYVVWLALGFVCSK